MLENLKNKLADKLFKDMGWQAVSELFIRVTRLFTAVVLARVFSPEQYGIIALALTTGELITVISRNGIGQKIIQVTEEKLKFMSNTAYKLNWIISLGLFVLQCSVALPVANFYNAPELFGLIICLSVVYLIYPFAMVQVFLTQRKKNLKLMAIATSLQISTDNILCAILALMGFGIWSVVIPKIIVAIIWVIYFKNVEKWQYVKTYGWEGAREAFDFGKKILASEMLKISRLHLDKLFIGYFLGLEALGIYYFAMNAGLGLSLSLINAFNITLYSHLCAVNTNIKKFKEVYIKSLKMMAIVAPLIMLSQSFLAPWYVPLIFGDKWTSAIPVLIILTLSGIPRPFGDGASQMLRALNNPQVDMKWHLIFTIIFVVAILIGVQFDILSVAIAILVVHAIAIPIFTWWANKKYLHEKYMLPEVKNAIN